MRPSIADRTALRAEPELRLDRNERLRPPPPLARLLRTVPGETLTRYPDARPLERRIARRWSIGPERVLVTAGADDAIDRLCRWGLARRPELVAVAPTFEMYPRFARLAGGRTRLFPWLRGDAPIHALAAAADDRTGLVVRISPHNPTGTATAATEIVRLAAALPEETRLVVDLAYVEFADHDPTERLLELPGVIVLRTLSKAWGLAGLRVGYALANADTIAALRAVGAPYPLAGPSLWLAERALDLGTEIARPHVRAVRRERERLVSLLAAAGVETLPSEANFVLAAFGEAEAIAETLAGEGIRVRRFPHLPGWLRITLPGDERAFARLETGLRRALNDRTGGVA